MVEILADAAAFERIADADITRLTQAATDATFYRDGLTDEEVAANRRIATISAPSCRAAAAADHQHFAAAFVEGAFAGYLIATAHAADDLELDWLMVDPRFHGTPVSVALMEAGIAWLGADKPLWLNVIRHNERAIRFYRKFGFEVDPDATTAHVVPHAIMRRPGLG